MRSFSYPKVSRLHGKPAFFCKPVFFPGVGFRTARNLSRVAAFGLQVANHNSASEWSRRSDGGTGPPLSGCLRPALFRWFLCANGDSAGRRSSVTNTAGSRRAKRNLIAAARAANSTARRNEDNRELSASPLPEPLLV
jgi:hypothetical protein